MFDYKDAFSRNIGWVTNEEQQFLSTKKVAIAGMGGVGSEHIVTLCRLGIQHFNIADFDNYDVHNFNRQAGAYMSTVGQAKCDVMAKTAQDINPQATLKTFPKGIDESNVDEFLAGIDIYIDSLDFFALDARKLVFAKCESLRIPVVTAAPLGMGTALLCFTPDSMSFTEYFDFKATDSEDDAYIKFLIGLSPSMLQRNYLVDPTKADFAAKKGPSTAMGVKLCAGAAATFALKLLLNRGKVPVAPHGFHFDAYNNKLKQTWRPWGNRNPIQKIAFKIAKSVVLKPKQVIPTQTASASPIAQIIDIAKWAPSGDNTQVWRFEITSDTSCIIHGYDTRDWVVYDLQGNASKLALGCLIENMSLAAQQQDFAIDYKLVSTTIDEEAQGKAVGRYTISVDLVQSTQPPSDVDTKLAAVIPLRTTQRRKMGTRALTREELAFFEQCLPEQYQLIWKSQPDDRKAVGKLLLGNAKTRLIMKEGFDVHSKIIEFTPRSKDNSPYGNKNNELSCDRIPAKSLGLDPLMLAFTKFSFSNWPVMEFVSKYLGGTVLPRLMLDYLPAVKSAGIFALTATQAPAKEIDYIEAGRAVQRVWLASAVLKLGFQPCQTPVIFSEYLHKGVKFSDSEIANDNAQKMEQQFQALFGEAAPRIVFMGRVGRSSTPKYRSVRLSYDELLKKGD